MAEMNQFEKLLVDKIQARLKAEGLKRFSSQALREKAERISLLLVLQTKKNIRGHKLIDTGNLLNSIEARRFTTRAGISIEYGSYGVDYAGVHEFGFRGIAKIPSHTRRIFGKTKTGRRKKKARASTRVRAHTRKMNIPERPFVRPSIEQRRKQIIKILLEARK